jgi:hypothetical protein
MDLFEASKFYGDYSLFNEIVKREFPEDFEDNNTPEEILSCSAKSNDLQ